jgi:hypothetical protein
MLPFSRQISSHHDERHVPVVRENQLSGRFSQWFHLAAIWVDDQRLHYVSVMRLACYEVGHEETGAVLPAHVTSWEGVLGFGVRGQEVAAPRGGELQLRFTVNRTGAVEFFGLLAYCGMIVLAVCALTTSTLVFVGIRRIEVTLVGVLGAIVFALPAMRNALPGAPPLGVRADVLVFFWAELAAVIAFSLFIAAWARRGAQP